VVLISAFHLALVVGDGTRTPRAWLIEQPVHSTIKGPDGRTRLGPIPQRPRHGDAPALPRVLRRHGQLRTHRGIYRKNSDAAARRVHELIDDGIKAGALRDVNGTFAAQVVALTIDAVQSGALLHSTGLTAGDAFAELGDLILDGLSRPAGS
jgi:hypothetical protein